MVTTASSSSFIYILAINLPTLFNREGLPTKSDKINILQVANGLSLVIALSPHQQPLWPLIYSS